MLSSVYHCNLQYYQHHQSGWSMFSPPRATCTCTYNINNRLQYFFLSVDFPPQKLSCVGTDRNLHCPSARLSSQVVEWFKSAENKLMAKTWKSAFPWRVKFLKCCKVYTLLSLSPVFYLLSIYCAFGLQGVCVGNFSPFVCLICRPPPVQC